MKHLTKFSGLLCAFALAACTSGIKSPEKSKLFEKRVDPVSGVVSYALKYGSPDGRTRFIQGMLDLKSGAWDEWGETTWNCNHGQLNPADDSLAMVAWESAWEAEGQAYQKETGWYPRMWLVRKGSKTLIPAEARNFASHEIWDDDGQGVSWCGHGKLEEGDWIYHYDLATGEQKSWAELPGARHNNCSPDGRYVVCDQAPEEWWRGCKWRVAFWNRDTGTWIFM